MVPVKDIQRRHTDLMPPPLAADGSRFNLYSGIHKAIRALMADALLAVGRMDVADNAEVILTCQRISQLMDMCTAHALQKKNLLHAVIEARTPGASDIADRGCRRHAEEFAGLREAADMLLRSTDDFRAQAAIILYQKLSLLVAENFQRMHREEVDYNALLWSNYSDEELVSVHFELMTSITPNAAHTVHWLLPLLNPGERMSLLSGLAPSALNVDLEARPDSARAYMLPHELDMLARGLGLEGKKGLAAPWQANHCDMRTVPIRDARILEAVAALHADPAHPWTVASLAKLCHLSRTAFTIRFRRQTSLPPMGYLAQWRVCLAAEILRQERVSLDQVAERVGYSSGAILARAYKRILGTAPRMHIDSSTESRVTSAQLS